MARVDTFRLCLLQKLLNSGGYWASLETGPEQTVRECVAVFQRTAQQVHYTGVAPTVTCDDKPEALGSVYHTGSKVIVLPRKIGGKGS